MSRQELVVSVILFHNEPLFLDSARLSQYLGEHANAVDKCMAAVAFLAAQSHGHVVDSAAPEIAVAWVSAECPSARFTEHTSRIVDLIRTANLPAVSAGAALNPFTIVIGYGVCQCELDGGRIVALAGEVMDRLDSLGQWAARNSVDVICDASARDRLLSVGWRALPNGALVLEDLPSNQAAP